MHLRENKNFEPNDIKLSINNFSVLKIINNLNEAKYCVFCKKNQVDIQYWVSQQISSKGYYSSRHEAHI